MQKVLTVGGAMYDAFIEYDTFGACPKVIEKEDESYIVMPVGKKVEVKNIAYHAGGGAVNSAVSFAKMGFEVEAFFKCGVDQEAEFIVNTLHTNNVKTDYTVHSQHDSTGRSFILPCPQGNCTILAYRGANKMLQESEIPEKAVKNADLLYITSLSGPASAVLFPLVALAKKHNKKTAVNPGTSQLSVDVCSLQKALPYIDILMLNTYEAQLLMGCVHGTFSIQDFCSYIVSQGPSTVVVTDGSKGVFVYTRSSLFFHPSIKTDVVSTVGAGDAFCSAFVSFLMYDYSFEKALYAGMVNSASVIAYVGAQTGLLEKREIEKKVSLFNVD